MTAPRIPRGRPRHGAHDAPGAPMDFRAMMALRQKRAKFFADEGVVAVLDTA